MEVFVGKIMSYSGDRLIDVDRPIIGEVSRGGVRLGHGPSATNVVLGARDAMYDYDNCGPYRNLHTNCAQNLRQNLRA